MIVQSLLPINGEETLLLGSRNAGYYLFIIVFKLIMNSKWNS